MLCLVRVPNEFCGALAAVRLPRKAHDLIDIEFPAFEIGLPIGLDNSEAPRLNVDSLIRTCPGSRGL